MINWRSIKDGFPIDSNKKYIVTDGIDISTSDISVRKIFKGDGNPISKFIDWTGDDNTSEDNSCCSGTKVFSMNPTHWCPISEVNLPNK